MRMRYQKTSSSPQSKKLTHNANRYADAFSHAAGNCITDADHFRRADANAFGNTGSFSRSFHCPFCTILFL